MKTLLFILLGILGLALGIVVYKTIEKKAIMQGRVIVLDGTSSSGKSTISQRLQQELTCEYLFIDNFLFNQTAAWLEKEILSKEGKKVQLPRNDTDAIRHYYDTMPNKEQYIISVEVFKNCLKKANDAMAQKTKELASQGKTIICDVVFAPGYMEESDFLKDLKSFKNVIVLVYCPFKTLAERVEKRNRQAREGKSGEVRSLVMALEQFGMKYKRKENQQEKTVDQLTRKDFNEAVILAQADFHIDFTKDDPETLLKKKQYEEFVKTLEKQLGFDDATIEAIEITPRTYCDLLVNTETNTLEECVAHIEQFIAATPNNPQAH